MTTRKNRFGQSIGAAMVDWTPRPLPPRTQMVGRTCRLEPLNPNRHARPLFDAVSRASGSAWTYLPYGPYSDFDSYKAWQEKVSQTTDPLFYAVVMTDTETPVGITCYQRIQPQHGVIELAHIHFAPPLQRTPAATEAIYLMLKRAFDELGYRRVEWKCDALNEPSRRAALRFGFSFESIFRQAIVYKNRTRDTAWYAMTDGDWLRVKEAHEAWLSVDNFDGQRKQLSQLSQLIYDIVKPRT